jgi:hypothetical protein
MIEKYTEADFKMFRSLSVKLGIPVPFVFIKLEVEKGGRILDRYEERSRTWNRNFWNYGLVDLTNNPIVATNFGAGYLSQKRTDGTVTAVAQGPYNYTLQVGAGVATWGIQVGLGTAAESFEGYVLATPVAHGTGTNQLAFAAISANTQSYDSPSKTWTITLKRLMNNNSAAGIVITETALTHQDSNSRAFVFSRDLLGASVTVNVGAQLTVQYAITLTFPA